MESISATGGGGQFSSNSAAAILLLPPNNSPLITQSIDRRSTPPGPHSFKDPIHTTFQTNPANPLNSSHPLSLPATMPIIAGWKENIGFLLGLDLLWIQVLAGKSVPKSICSLLFAVAASAQLGANWQCQQKNKECMHLLHIFGVENFLLPKCRKRHKNKVTREEPS
jgi:hypothetical protein